MSKNEFKLHLTERGNFLVLGGDPGSERDGGSGEGMGETWSADIHELCQVSQLVGVTALRSGLAECGFSTAHGDLIATNVIGLSKDSQQVAVWNPETAMWNKN